MSQQQQELTPKTEAPPNGAAKQDPPSDPNATAIVPVSQDEPGRALSAFSSESAFVAAQRMARALASSTLVPEAYRNNIPNVLIAMELANRIGASVFMVMQNLDVIHGNPGWRGKFLIATINSSGRFTPLRFEWRGKEGSDDWGCRAVAKDKASGEVCVGSWVTWAMAKAEGWTKKNGSKWLTMPEQMFMYRAGAFWSRVYAPELSLGMSTAEEIIDTVGVELAPMATPEALTPGNVGTLESALRAKASSVTQTADVERQPGEDD